MKNSSLSDKAEVMDRGIEHLTNVVELIPNSALVTQPCRRVFVDKHRTYDGLSYSGGERPNSIPVVRSSSYLNPARGYLARRLHLLWNQGKSYVSRGSDCGILDGF